MARMVRIASVKSANKCLLKPILEKHNVMHRFDPYPDGDGYHVFVALNHELYFREIISPEYKAVVNMIGSKVDEYLSKRPFSYTEEY